MFSFYWLGLKKIFNFGKKILLILFVYFAMISLFLYFIDKDKPKITYDPTKKTREEIYKVINDPQLTKTTEGKIMIASYRMILCGMIGEACTDNPDDGDKNFNRSVFGFMANLLVLPYANPPASGVYWAYSGLQNAGFVPKTYAAEGIGFAAIKPLMNIWKVFRDLSYMLLVLVLISIGFMIMFRAKINPQTVISIENSIPKIVISLLLITFSFPLAGLLIDLMYVIIIILIAILGNRGNFFDINTMQNQYLNANLDVISKSIFPKGVILDVGQLSQAILAVIPLTILSILKLILGIAAVIFFNNIFQDAHSTADTISDTGGSIPGVNNATGVTELLVKIALLLIKIPLLFLLGYLSLPLIVSLLIFGGFLVALFRVFFLLFSAYIKIFLLIVFSPFFMLFEAIPGKSSFSYWLKNILVELLSFPIIIAIFLLGYIIINVFPNTGQIWQPPFLIQLEPAAFTTLVGFGLILMAPDLIKTVKQLIGAKEMPVGLSLGTFFGASGAFLGGAIGMTQKIPSITALLPPGMQAVARGKLGSWLGGILIPPSEQERSKQLAKEIGKSFAGVIKADKEGKLDNLLKDQQP